MSTNFVAGRQQIRGDVQKIITVTVSRFVNKPNPRIQQSQSNAEFNNRLANSELCN